MLRGFNEALSAAAAAAGHLVLDVARMTHLVGAGAWWPGRYYYSAKLPFALACVPFYGDNIGRILAAKLGKSRRALILDLDNTLWGGVIGDDGLEGIVIGQGSAVGEAHLSVQRIAKAYARRGIVLCVASKNTHEVAIEAFHKHPDMLLREEDIAAFQINWQDKAGNIRAMAETLNLGLDAFVFLDDNPVERKQVRDALPLVAVPELPLDPADWPLTLAGAGYFEQVSFTEEDRQRGKFYKSLADRSKLERAAGDTGAFLESLDTEVTFAPFDATGRKRIAQLISKSNQYNLTTRRYAEADVERFEKDADAVTLQIRLNDMFGDAGMISVIIGRRDGEALDVDLWLMSCRVLGRRVEEAALKILVDRAHAMGLTKITGSYIPSARNGIVADHYKRLGFASVRADEDGTRLWELPLTDYSAPDLPMRLADFGKTLEISC
ncbi:MAG: HAD-IIIC family phosphatase [Sphingomonadales bacterium]|nr:MAG: HAD-IIIC family phosphatase [Sphingomonadales bacterium]